MWARAWCIRFSGKVDIERPDKFPFHAGFREPRHSPIWIACMVIPKSVMLMTWATVAPCFPTPRFWYESFFRHCHCQHTSPYSRRMVSDNVEIRILNTPHMKEMNKLREVWEILLSTIHFILNPGWQVLFATVCRIDDGWTCIYKQFWSVRVQVQKRHFFYLVLFCVWNFDEHSQGMKIWTCYQKRVMR